MKTPVIAIFDIGKTNKKMVLFDRDLKMVMEQEHRFATITDDDGFECDDIELIEKWIKDSISDLVKSDIYDVEAVNFSTYGATLAYLDINGNRLTPIYNYLKPIDERIPENLYCRYGGRDEFCRRTASPALGMLNSGIQALWLKNRKPEIFRKVEYILHFPQYISYTLTGKIYSEHTSIGCHTALWDFDKMKYHYWVESNGLNFPQPVPADTFNEIEYDGKKIKVGIGLHDSSASLAPYLSGDRARFLLLSTGTWCINMNPFNEEKLTAEQLDMDCLCYMSITGQPVKSSRLFLGYMHEHGAKLISDHFNVAEDFYKIIKADRYLLSAIKNKFSYQKVFFKPAPDSREFMDYIDMYIFKSPEEAYCQLMNELCDLTVESISLVIPENDKTENIYITGGFSLNRIFLTLICEAFPGKSVFTSEIANSSALGAALVISGTQPHLNLGLTECFSAR